MARLTPFCELSTLKPNMERHDAVIDSLLGTGTRYEGKLFFEGKVRIDGDFEGEVQSDGLLVLGPEATVRGAIRVHTLIVQGATVDADIHATELVELHAPARVRGDIRTRALYMDKGAVFDGNCIMGQVLDLDESPQPSRSAEDTSPDGYKDQPSRS
ncbi:MAG: polymer-forming cytoskeletal protein [Deltaproteobacteria bacterium]|nr:polymer-forming cytoskeletal protein [Deltaproteobacteria bacterium]